MKKFIISALMISIVVMLCSCATMLNSLGNKNNSSSYSNTEKDNKNSNSLIKKENDDSNLQVEKAKVIKYDFDTTDYTKFSVGVLKEYGEYMIGEKVITSFVISGIDNDSLKASDGGLMYSLICKFNTKKMKDLFKTDEKVTVAGIVEEVSFDAPRLKDCIVIGKGEIFDEIEADAKAQKKIAKKIKKKKEEQKQKELEAERNEYAESCEKVVYRDVERNPDSFKGKKIRISGEVIQVAEGFFDSVTLRVEDKDGNVWYVTYTRKDGESRILEDDNITCYGECDGVETYTSVLGRFSDHSVYENEVL